MTISAVFLTGCESEQERRARLRDVLGVYRYAEKSTTENRAIEIKTETGQVHRIDRIPLIHSRVIEKIIAVQRTDDKGWGILLQLSERGARHWMLESQRTRGHMAVVLCDDEFLSTTAVDGIQLGGRIFVPGPFTKARAEEIAANAEKNYEFYND